jgi:hypothetical protein
VLVIATAVVMLVITRYQTCQDAVDTRQGQRAMWLYIIDLNPDDERVAAFSEALDERIPELTCKGGKAVPVEDP